MTLSEAHPYGVPIITPATFRCGMQPEQTAPAPAIQPAPVPVAVAPMAGGGPDRTVMVHTGLVLVACLLYTSDAADE